uniref:Uncharacterized protein n=1 Tax=Oryza sativa subsp. japonica TaxID=39947 RepID=Q84R82_ORYSJ|nr:hypothetical protein [Oryza sativa Japonica Group]
MVADGGLPQAQRPTTGFLSVDPAAGGKRLVYIGVDPVAGHERLVTRVAVCGGPGKEAAHHVVLTWRRRGAHVAATRAAEPTAAGACGQRARVAQAGPAAMAHGGATAGRRRQIAATNGERRRRDPERQGVAALAGEGKDDGVLTEDSAGMEGRRRTAARNDREATTNGGRSP